MKWKKSTEEINARNTELVDKAKVYYDRSSHDLQPMDIGEKVRIQDASTKRWDKVGVIVDRGNRRNYRVKVDSGRVYWRNRRFLRKFHDPDQDDEADADESLHDSPLRRSGRVPFWN